MAAYHAPENDSQRSHSFPGASLWNTLSSLVGSFAVAAALALSLPGVVARAEAGDPGELVSRADPVQSFVDQVTEAPAAVSPDGAVCRAGEAEKQVHMTGQKLALLQQKMMARAAADAAREGRKADEIVVLNGRGYGYAVAPDPSNAMEMLQREMNGELPPK